MIWGAESTSVRMKSFCDPTIMPETARKKPTPMATPKVATRVWRARTRRWARAILARTEERVMGLP